MKTEYIVRLVLGLLIFGLVVNAALSRLYWWGSDDPDPVVAWHESTVNRRLVPSLRIINEKLLIGKTEAEVIGMMGKPSYTHRHDGYSLLGWYIGDSSVTDLFSRDSAFLQAKVVDGVVIDHSIHISGS